MKALTACPKKFYTRILMDPRVKTLVDQPKVAQRSPEWYDLRSNMITASSASNLLVRDNKTCDLYIDTFKLNDIFDKDSKCCNPYSSRNQYILEKCRGSKFKGSVATLWGQQYEDVVCDIYRNKFDTDVIDFGIIQHPEHKWLGASPDGITPGGVMLEIKCPFRRKITGVVPLYYWIQVMLQLEVCGLDDCDFAEYEFMEFSSEEEFLDDETLDKTIHHKGIMIKIETTSDAEGVIVDPAENKYIYPPRELLDKGDDLINWAKSTVLETIENFSDEIRDTKIVSPVYWKVVDFSIVRLKRSVEWFEKVRPDFEKAWNEILFYRKGNNYRHLISKEDDISELSGKILHLDISSNACILSDSESDFDGN